MRLFTNLFKITNCIALLAWIFLFSYPLWPVAARTMVTSSIVVLLSVVYSYLMFFGKIHDEPGTSPRGSFFSLPGVIRLFKSPRAVLAGWIHYLAFDLMVGLFIVMDAAAHGMPHWILLPALFMTLMFGPAGLLIYLAMRLYMGGADLAGSLI